MYTIDIVYDRHVAQVEFGDKALFHILSCVVGIVTHLSGALCHEVYSLFEVDQKLVTLGG